MFSGRGMILRKRIFRPFVLVGGALLAAAPARAEFDGDLRLWNSLNIREYGDDTWGTRTMFHIRSFDEASFLGLWRVNQKATWRAHPNLDLAAAYTFQESRPETDAPWRELHRPELEANPRFRINDALRFHMRNRLEFRAAEGDFDDVRHVSRHRLALFWEADAVSWLEAIGAHTEFFYDYEGDFYSENRFTPVQASFDLADKGSGSVFFMARTRRPNEDADWQTAWVVGADLSFDARGWFGR